MAITAFVRAVRTAVVVAGTLGALGVAAQAAEGPCGWPGYDEERLYAFLEAGCYRGWNHDNKVRDTGPFLNRSTLTAQDLSFGVHPAVRVYYNDPAWRWLQGGRNGEIPDDALLVKEMYDPPAARYDGLDGDALQAKLGAWTTMVRAADRVADGWYWSFHMKPAAEGGADAADGWEARVRAELAYPDSGFGSYCTRCHSSAVSDGTFASLQNAGDDPTSYTVTPPRFGPDAETAGPGAHAASVAETSAPGPQLPQPLPAPRSDFLALFHEIPEVSTESVRRHAMPPETYDHVFAPPEAQADPEVEFITSDQCIGCHDATEGMQWNPPMLVADSDSGAILNFSPYAEWRMSMMGLAGRDPIFFAQLESERNIHPSPELQAKTQDLCLHCHGVMGQRQFTHDNPGQPFTRAMAQDHTTDLDANAEPPFKYGALARDGISCAVCHRISPEGLGTPATYTGDFELGPSDELYGPYQDVKQTPMRDALDITPLHGEAIQSSELCGSCHTVYLPVYDGNEPVPDPDDPSKQRHIFEQTTYLEWTNSVYAREGTAQSCQDCHMRTHHEGEALDFPIAAIETDDYPETENRLPDAEIDLQPRKPFSRHTLLGINLFAMEMFQQFPLVLGIRTQDPMAPPEAQPAWLTAEQAVVRQARQETAEIAVGDVGVQDATLRIPVTVTNKVGHKFPSGVGFRRAFIELTVADEVGSVLWGSGRTNALGVILGGRGEPLPSEFVGTATQAFQPHHEIISAEDHVQIYEILEQNARGKFTTSFLGLDRTIKDNRLLPKGWRRDGPHAEETKACRDDPTLSGNVSHHEACKFLDEPGYNDGSGRDLLTYAVACRSGMAGQLTVRARLYYQAIPPYYLKQRFATAQGPDAQRLHYFGSRLDVANTPIAGWKLLVAETARSVDGAALCGG